MRCWFLLFFVLPCAVRAEENGSLEPVAIDCDSSDISSPEVEYPLSISHAYLIDSYHALFGSSLEEEEQLYLSGLHDIASENLAGAEKALQELVSRFPNHPYGAIQLGFVYLWQEKWVEAKEMFDYANTICPCSQYGVIGMKKLASLLLLREGQEKEALEIYRILHACEPDSYEYLFGLARALSRTQNRKEAEQVLKKVTAMAPDDSDAALLLADLYYWEGKFEEAKRIYEQYPDRIEAIEGKAKIALAQSNYKEAIQGYEKVVKEQPENREAFRNLARSYAMEFEFTRAKASYYDFLALYPEERRSYAELFDVKLHTDPALDLYTSFVRAKENDPQLKQPVVLDYYFNSYISLMLPIRDQWQVELRPHFDYQKERSIVPTNPGINYDVYLAGGAVYSHLLFANNWKWNFSTNVKRAWNVGQSAYPFQNTTRIEPSSYLIYDTDRQTWAFGGNIDSFIIKNFDKIVSQLLTVKAVDMLYSYTAPIKYSPQITGWVEEAYFESIPRNRRDTQQATFNVFLPGLEEFLQVFYTYEHRHFSRLNINYYSFKQQWRDTVGFTCTIHKEKSRMALDVTYWHRWQNTKDLFQPIGDFVFVAPLQKLKCNQVEGTLTLRLNEHFQSSVVGTYYRDTLPYRAWRAQANLLFVF